MTGRAASRRTRRRRRAAVIGVLAVVAVGGLVAGGAAIAGAVGRPAASVSPTVSPGAAPAAAAPMDAATALLAATDAQAGGTVADACVVTFAGDGISQAPDLERAGQRYMALPIPTRDGMVFAGWYPTADDATAYDATTRVNGADMVACTDRQQTLYGAWQTPDQVAAADVGVPILMYHQFTDKPGGEDNWLKLNYIYTGDFDAQMKYLADQKFYLPTWDEMDAFLDGTLSLPDHSVVITDDDADPTWYQMGVPIVDKYQLLTTSFQITVSNSQSSPSVWVQLQTHTNDMHRAGSDGQGRIMTMAHDDIVADLTTSEQILGTSAVLAYPYGHNDAAAQQAVADSGISMAVTVDGGYAKPGENKLALPRERINYGTTLDEFIDIVG